MKAKEKVMKLFPDVECLIVTAPALGDYKKEYMIGLNKKVLSKLHSRESWAWAEAYRRLTPSST